MSNFGKGDAKFGHDLQGVKEIFNSGIPFEDPLAIDYLIDIPNASVALQALEFLQDQNNEIELRKRHSPADVERAWRGVLRGCLNHGVAIPHNLRGFARRLGVVLPE